jgi:predicted nucleic acid-binding protein
MTRPEHSRAAGLSASEVGTLLDALLAAVAESVRASFRWRSMLADPDDDMMLEATVNGRADAIVTFHRRDFASTARFGIAVPSPGAAMEEGT